MRPKDGRANRALPRWTRTQTEDTVFNELHRDLRDVLRDLRGKAVFVLTDGRRHEQLAALASQNDPVRALLLIEVEPLAVVATDALAGDDFRSANRAPFARLLADLARLALGPAFDPEVVQVRQHTERRSDGTEETAIQIPHEDRRKQQRPEADPHRRRPEQTEHPERFDIAVDGKVSGREKIDDHADE